MISIDADHLDHKALNDRLRGIKAPVQLTNCCGQRFIAAGMAPSSLSITGVPGNALGAYLNGGKSSCTATHRTPRRHDERWHDHRSRQHRRRGGLRHARREDLRQGERGLPRGHPHQGV